MSTGRAKAVLRVPEADAPKRHDGHVVAFMDLGTNSVRLSLVQVYQNHSYTTLTQQKEVIRLGEDEYADGYLHPAAMERAILVCTKFAELSRSHGAGRIVTVATSAVRDARNQKEFLQRLNHEAGIDVRVISGREEARLIYLGVANAVHLGDKAATFIDIGGGSTEIIVGDQKQYQFLGSLNLGAVRLSSIFSLNEQVGSVSPKRYALLQRYVRNASIRTLQQMKDYHSSVTLGSSGTVENLTDIAARVLHNRARRRDDVLSYADLRRVIQLLCERNLEERRRIPGINPERADIIIAGAAILDTLMQDLKLLQMRVISDQGLREGMVVDYLSRSEHAVLFRGTSVRERSVLQLARACGFDGTHAQHTARLALEIFDSAKKAGLHGLGDSEREILEYASLLHDIGAFLSYNNHHLHTYYLIRNAELVGFNEAEIELIAVTALFHRKGMPSKEHPAFASLDRRTRKTVRLLSAFLRIAEGLDRSHNSVVAHAKLRGADSATAQLELQATGDCQLELWGVEDRLNALKKVLDREIAVKVKRSAGKRSTSPSQSEPAGVS